MHTVFYTTSGQRAAFIAQAEAAGETMIHDDFNVGPDGEHRLTFDTLPSGGGGGVRPPSSIDLRLDAIEARLTALERR